MPRIKGKRDGQNGRNDHFDVGKRKNVKKSVVAKEVEQGIHPEYHVFKLNGQKFIRANPNKSKADNVN